MSPQLSAPLPFIDIVPIPPPVIQAGQHFLYDRRTKLIDQWGHQSRVVGSHARGDNVLKVTCPLDRRKYLHSGTLQFTRLAPESFLLCKCRPFLQKRCKEISILGEDAA